ncbi:MAG: aminodeoxychorismate synthase component I [Chlorobiaceae bacterium]|nr:aminodeoxychorismate synthase component I [Chlorobiaceae bacterium]
MFYKKRSPLQRSEGNEIDTLDQLADLLRKEGSVWLESAFCKGEKCGALLFMDPVDSVQLSSLSDIEPFFNSLEKKLDEGYYLAGWMSYEAGYGFEPAIFPSEYASLPRFPLAWFGVYREPFRLSTELVAQLFSEDAGGGRALLTDLSFNLSREEYIAKISTIREEIAAGNVYQVNFTGRYHFTCDAPAPALFSRLRSLQPASYTAWLNCGGRTILSFSPELFFMRHGSVIETMPMKGTAPRGSNPEEDNHLRERLGECSKNRAENLMIVDLLRNDLGRICRPGSVETGGLFVTETWPTLHQMVSTIRGEERQDIRLYELFRALYPSGSITGAPKIKAMKLIQSLESEPRGIYTGAIGYMTPERNMLFNVAIRTMELSPGEGTYGSGSGIVWDSDPAEEYRECRLKAKILEGSVGEGVQLFESILWNGSYLWLDEHILRMEASAHILGFPFEKRSALQHLNRLEEELSHSGIRFKVRLNLSREGAFSTIHEPVALPDPALPVRLALADRPTDSVQPELYHKTTARNIYDDYFALARKKGFDEVLFLNERKEVTEGAISTLFIRKGNQFFTPPIRSGILNGIFRSYFLSTRSYASEKVITLQDLKDADMIYIANSVRGLRPAVFTGEQIKGASINRDAH